MLKLKLKIGAVRKRHEVDLFRYCSLEVTGLSMVSSDCLEELTVLEEILIKHINHRC